MLCPELTYQYQQLKDAAGGSLLLLRRRSNVSEASATPTIELYTVPSDKIAIFSAVAAQLEPGTGQIAQTGLARVKGETTGTGAPFLRFPEIQNATADRRVAGYWSGQVWAAPGEVLEFTSLFNAATNPNGLTVSAFGILIPRGNIQQG